MKRHRHRFYRLLAQYNRYRRKLSRIEQGISFYRRKDLLIRRLKRLQERLLAIKELGKVATLSTALSAGFLVGGSQLTYGQNLQLKTDNVLQLALVEANAKPVLVDWDEDGDLDLFVGGQVTTALDSSAAGVRYYVNDGGRFNQGVSPFPLTLEIDGVGSDPTTFGDSLRVSPAFIDLDSDGDLDAFVGQSNGTLLYYRNDDGSLVKVTGAENPFDGVKVGDSSHASPTFVDVDGDGDLDAVIGKYSGNLAYFKNDDGVFTDQTGGVDPFADINVTESATPSFVDWDNDGDMDLFVGNKAGELAYFENVEGVYTPVDNSNNPFSGISMGYSIAPAFADIDGDGDLDAFIGQSYGDIIYLRNDAGTFKIVERNPLGLGVLGDNLNHGFVDIDGDGDPDIFSGDFYGVLTHYINDGGVFSLAAMNPLDTPLVQVDYLSAPAFADIDGDGDVDAFVGSYQQNIKYFANDAGVFTAVTGTADPFDGINAGDNENIAFVDWDNDGDLDAFIGNKAGEVKYYENTEGVFAEVVGAGNPFDGISFQIVGSNDYSARPALADLDGDGDFDAYIGLADGSLQVWKNDGGILTRDEDDPLEQMNFLRATAPSFIDLDSDGDLDLIVTNAAGHTYYFENSNTVSAKEVTFSPETKVYPNPTSGAIRLEMPWSKKSTDIQVFSATGQLIQHFKVTVQNTEIFLQNYPSGLYLVKLVGAEGAAAKKVWKQ